MKTHTHWLVSQADCLAQRVSLIHLMTSPLQVFVKGKSFEGDGVTLGTKAGVKTRTTLWAPVHVITLSQR